MRLTGLAHELLFPRLFPGAFAMDGTAGQGHDTLFLAQAVAPAGHVVAFDPQPAALAATQARLTHAGFPSQIPNLDASSPLHLFPSSPLPVSSVSVCLVQAGHENAPRLLPDCPPLHAVVLNLGYLPGADHSVTTTAPHTLAFLAWAVERLSPRGALSILAYRAHPGGEEEAQAVAAFTQKLASANWSHQTHQGPPGRLPSPILHFLTKP